MHATCVGAHIRKIKRASDLGAGVTGSCQPPDVAAGN